jgi:thiol-disulfide isomerase/thioredoxin
MKKIIVSVIALLLFMGVSAQNHDISVDPTAPYLKDKRLPAFVLNTIDGREITNKQLPTNYKYIALIFFSPDCSHCETEAANINKYADKLNGVLFVWNSYRDLISIKGFAEKFKFVNKPNMIVGRDPSYMIPSFFHPKMTPYVALYKNGSLVKVYDKGADIFDFIKIIEGK